jgi:mannose-6-phosphate isomerase-like protein (cupin superfamily)
MEIEIVRRDHGERVSGKVEILAGREELVVTESLYPPGVSGPEPHIHREHADSFYVLEGELTFVVGPDLETRKAGPGGFVLAPPEVVHTFRNEGPAAARFINIHAPGKGFDDYLRAMRDGTEYDFDAFDPPEDGGRPVSEILLLEPGDPIEVGSEQRPGKLCLSETTIPPGFDGPLPHAHEHTVDSFYVVEGSLSLRGADGETEIGAGTYVLAPPGVPHGFANGASGPARLLNVAGL